MTTAPALPEGCRCAPAMGRGFLRITGEDRVSFLQGLVTCDMKRLTERGILYGAHLSPQGKYLASFFLVPDGADGVLMDMAEAELPAMAQRLAMFKLRAKVNVDAVERSLTLGIGPAPEGALPDPRDPAMGWRLYGAALSAGAPLDWDAIRVAAGVPEAGIELVPGESFILEMGLERLGGVDFRKGCYVGQEVTARMHLKTELRKGLVQVEVVGAALPGAAITTADGREAGVLMTRAGDRALAYLRFERAEGPLTAGQASVRWLRS
jgi:tRNA-modifying protein YgfZ